MNVTEKINSVINALNNIEIKGLQNINILLACAQTLEEIKIDLAKENENG